MDQEIEKMDQEIETVVVHCYKCGEIERRPNLRSESEDENVIENIAHGHIKENPGHVVLIGFEISD
jgi:hypothetical protein